MINRTSPKSSATLVFTETEIAILNRQNDGPPGNIVLWRGLSRLTDIHMGVDISKKLVVIESLAERTRSIGGKLTEQHAPRNPAYRKAHYGFDSLRLAVSSRQVAPRMVVSKPVGSATFAIDDAVVTELECRR